MNADAWLFTVFALAVLVILVAVITRLIDRHKEDDE